MPETSLLLVVPWEDSRFVMSHCTCTHDAAPGKVYFGGGMEQTAQQRWDAIQAAKRAGAEVIRDRPALYDVRNYQPAPELPVRVESQINRGVTTNELSHAVEIFADQLLAEADKKANAAAA